MSDDLPDLDRFDRAILAALSGDGRMPVTELARRIGLSKTPTQARVKRLEETGVIAGYRAVLNPIRMGLANIAYVEVRLTDTREAALQAFNRAVRAVPEMGGIVCGRRFATACAAGVVHGAHPGRVTGELLR